jgi:hypothetical protein
LTAAVPIRPERGNGFPVSAVEALGAGESALESGQLARASSGQRRREALAVIADRARARGDLPNRPESGTVADLIFGTIWYRVLATRQPFDARLVEDLVALLAEPASSPGRRQRPAKSR